MNSNSDTATSMNETIDEESTSNDDDMREINYQQRSREHITRSSAGSTSSNGTTETTNNGSTRQKEISPCYVCGAKANGYNFDQITCESCKAFFRRNALKAMEKYRCRNDGTCIITSATRKRCKRCRLTKCFRVGMRKEWILTDEEKTLKRQKIVHNRIMKHQARLAHDQPANDPVRPNTQVTIKATDKSSSLAQPSVPTSSALMYMYHSPNQLMFERQQCLLEQLSEGYHSITIDYPQPKKFIFRKAMISQTVNLECKISLIKDLTRELTQMTTLRLLNFFNLIPEFQLLTQNEKQSLLIKNMLAVFMFHGALTYDSDNDTFVDHTTADGPYEAKYLLFVYGPKVYNTFRNLAILLTSVTYQTKNDKQLNQQSHTLFLLLMVVLLFSDGFQAKPIEENQTKSLKIQQCYVEIACRFLHDQFGYTVGRKMFQKLVPLLMDLQKLCSTLAHVNLCEMAEDEDRSSSRGVPPTKTKATTTTTYSSDEQLIHSAPVSSSTEFNSRMISGTSHLNELQKENRAPAPPSSSLSAMSLSSSSSNIRLSPSVLSSTTPTIQNYHI